MAANEGCKNPACEQGFIYIDHHTVKPCPECERRKRASKLSDLYARAALPAVLQGYRLPSRKGDALTPVELSEPGWNEITEHVDHLPEIIEEGINFIFTGPTGTGKSQAGALMLAEAARRGYTSAAISAPDFIMLVANGYGKDGEPSEYEHIDRLTAVDLLMIDDVGADMPKDAATTVRLLSRVITKRYELMRPTILTTNAKTVAESDELGGLLGDRAYERIKQNGVIVIFDGKNYREDTQKSRKGSYLARLKLPDAAD